jgi:hypothetical protein
MTATLPTPAKDPRATVAAARAQIVTLRRKYLDRGQRQMVEYYIRIPSIEEAQRDLAVIEHAVSSQAPPDIGSRMVAALLKGWDRPPGNDAEGQLSVYLSVLYDDDTEEEASDHGDWTGYAERGPHTFSTEVLAFAIMRLWKTSKFKPAPCELLDACKQERNRMNRFAHALRRAIEIARQAA